MSYFEELEFNSFKDLWENSSEHINDENTEKIYRIIELIKKIVNIFNELRLKQASSEYGEKFEYEFSYRDAEQIFRRFNMVN
jgi:predicted house-cleaning noncanonical NTP pyrophosphatase (MazG superfamily)